MPQYAVVNADNIVENVVVWDGASLWRPPEGRILVDAENKKCNVGWKHDNGEFTDPNPPEETTTQEPDTQEPTTQV